MPRKKANEAAIAPPPVSEASESVTKKTRKPAVARRKAAPKPAEEMTNSSIAQLADAVGAPVVFDPREIEERAYQSWIERGCPMGSPEEDWYRAERELIARFAAAAK